MLEEAISIAKKVFRVARKEQQFPHLPFLFGAYDIPPSQFSFFHRFQSTSSLHESPRLFQELMSGFTTQSFKNMRLGLAEELRDLCERSITLLKKQGVKIAFLPTESQPSTNVIGESLYLAPMLSISDLNPAKEDLRILHNVMSLSKDKDKYANTLKRYSTKEITSDIDYLMKGFDVSAVLQRKRTGVLSDFDKEQLCILHLHLNTLEIQHIEVLIAHKDSHKIVLTNASREEIDGEADPNVHILHLHRISNHRKSDWLEKTFKMDQWYLEDIDFTVDSSRLANKSKR